jgi:hypothetical protein
MTTATTTPRRKVLSTMRPLSRASRLLAVTACLVLIAATAATASAQTGDATKFALDSVDATLSDTQAGGHPDMTTIFSLSKDPLTDASWAPLKDLKVELPPGFTAYPSNYPSCPVAQFVASTDLFGVTSGVAGCPIDSQVGVIYPELNILPGSSIVIPFPVFNLTPGPDEVARLGFDAIVGPSLIDVRVRPGDYGLTATSTGILDSYAVNSAATTLWGDPTDPSHDSLRMTTLESIACSFPCNAPGGTRPSGMSPRPFMTNPTSCGPAAEVKYSVTSYEEDTVRTASAPLPQLTGCDSLAFSPSLSARPTTRRAASPSGLDVDLRIPQINEVDLPVSSQLKDATVTLPAGLTLNPAAADGLDSCTSDQVGIGSSSDAACPAASKIGSATIDSPALLRPVQAAIYQRTPSDGKLLRLWLVADDLGVHLKLPGELTADPTNGQLTSTFSDNPQLPMRGLQLHFRGGSRGVLATPGACGNYTTNSKLAPWSGRAPAEVRDVFTIDQNCATGGFNPQLSAGLANTQGGSSSAFTLQLTRSDGEQNVNSLTTVLPAGLLASIKGIERCGDAQAAAGDCPEASRVGS